MLKVLLIVLSVFSATLLYAHSGGTDENGCHYNHKTGDYHCH